MKNQFLLLIISAQAKAFGAVLQSLDTDDKGTDDIFGHVLSTAGSALQSYASSNDAGVKKYLKIIADSIYDFLGLQPAPQTNQ